MWNGDSFEKKGLKKSALEVYEKLYKKFKDYPGEKPKKNATVFMGVGTANARIVKDCGVPESLYKLFKDDPLKLKHYF